ncbi:tetrathionate reductase family octaheme c-type cytochrome [Ruixingdingia sedimenti]|uniref:Tetrathionate reductase family octaheme c-type cytochrome n=1 Tax=Ruixingdingia sedimenti TaxID=3073604 RepID=A0ABU1F5V8_9RHOB|nr:tetrathionate reductase family octaheme c-type cytochrome [Xinfangfangia sp. LG-4]MDR5652261.1 tetrathionate reductase family octaheme c-type cytochrome [Xinfangfangia sp. LG-4]
MPPVFRALRLAAWAVCITVAAAQAQEAPAVPGLASTADHSKFPALKGPFSSGPEVTAACLSCHTEAGDQVMHTLHWSWDYTHPETGQKLGKANVVNSFCGNVGSNETRCTSCHTGYGWTDVRQPPPQDPARVDCLACHDRSGQYTKLDNMAGHPPLDPVPEGAKTITGKPAWPVDLAQAARSVGPPGRENCGSCHFYGGGGDNVKHGDLSSALVRPDLATDVHMSPEGGNFTCQTCHVTEAHRIAGSRYDTEAKDIADPHLLGQPRDAATCESCHGNRPHEATPVGLKLNDHTDRLACQTCHVPEFARGGVATKTLWDWSTAGQLKDGKPFSVSGFTRSDGKELETYLSTKGTFEWAENVAPHYAWFDGTVEYTNDTTAIDPSAPVEINPLHGASDDPGSRIWPFKRMEGRQAYDTERMVLLHSQVYGPETDTAFWTNFDWSKSLQAASDYLGTDYSGKFDFVDTQMYWPITHMVAPADDALKCDACHARDGRMANLAGVYIPGAGLPPGGMLGLALLALAAAGVAGHGMLRLIRRKGGHHG